MNEEKKINRRTFVQQSGILMSASCLPFTGFPMMSSRKYKMGLQLYTIRDAMKQDAVGSLKKVRALGYEDLELYGYDGDNGSYYGYKAADFKKILEDHDLTTTSGHYGLADYINDAESMTRYVDQCITGALALGQDYITWPWMAPEHRNLETFKRLPELLNTIGSQISQAGLGFAYHNHDFEFVEYDGQTGYDIISSETDPKLVKFQLDMYWAVHSSKLSVPALIAREPKRFVMWHIKDMDKVTRDYSELGNGSIDYDSILREASQTGLQYYYLEQGGNFATNSMQSITDSAKYFNKHLKKYL